MHIYETLSDILVHSHIGVCLNQSRHICALKDLSFL